MIDISSYFFSYCSINIKHLIEIPQNSSALIALDVTNGTITVDNLDLQNVESSPTYFYAMLGAGSGVISLSTVNGNIVMTGF